MTVFDHPEFDTHESVQFFNEPESGLQAIIAVHSTALGPAAGGCRRWHYADGSDAVTDVLRLSRGMTNKNAVAGLPFGGGKSVILAPPGGVAPSPDLFRAFGRAVDALQGRYITAEDVGVSVGDMRIVREQTRYVSGLPAADGNAGGDPSPWTARGVFMGIQESVATRLGTSSLQGVRVAVQGVGNVGSHLCKMLHDAGAELVVADVNRRNLQALRDQIPATELPTSEILFADVDVLAPCALGNILDAGTIPNIRAKIVAGAANNQLATDRDGQRLVEREILYAPDYVINAGGVISVAREYLGNSSEQQVSAEVAKIPERLRMIFSAAAQAGAPTSQVADELAARLVAGSGHAEVDRQIA